MRFKNSSYKGQSFIPQNNLQIVIDDNSFDAEDLDSSFDYVKNALQDRFHRPHAKRVQYDYRTDSYNWIGPSKGRRMSLPRAEFESEMQD